MRRLLLVSLLLLGCSIEVPPDPLTSGVVPTCDKGSVLQGGQCTDLSLVKGKHAALAASAASATTVTGSADQADYADTATHAHGVSPGAILNFGTGTSSGSIYNVGSLRIFGGAFLVDGQPALAHLGTFVSDGATDYTTSSSSSAQIPMATPGGGSASLHLDRPTIVRVVAHGTVGGDGNSSKDEFATCYIRIQFLNGPTPPTDIGATVSAYDYVPSGFKNGEPFRIEAFLQLDAGDYDLNVDLAQVGGVTGSTGTPACHLNAPVLGPIKVQIDGA